MENANTTSAEHNKIKLLESVQQDFAKISSDWEPQDQNEDTTEERRILLLDESRGRYLGETIQEIASNYGWNGDTLDADNEYYSEAVQEAEDYLNGLLSDTNYSFYQDGSFFVCEIRDKVTA